MGKYFLENVHAAHPSARCGIVVGSKGAMIRDLLSAYPWIEVIEVNRRHPRALIRFICTWQGSDLVLTQYAAKEHGRFSLMSKLAARCIARRGGMFGFEDAARWVNHLYDVLIPLPPGAAPALLERKALAAADIRVAFPTPTISPVAFSELPVKKPYVVVHLFSGSQNRGLSSENKRTLLMELSKALPQLTLILTGGDADQEEAHAIAQSLPVTIFAGGKSLTELIALMQEAALVVSVDTGAAHVAAELHRPLIVLATCLGLHWWQKDQYPDQEIKLFTRLHKGAHEFVPYPKCLNTIDMAEVAQSAARIIRVPVS